MHDLLHSASKNNPSLSKMIGSIAPYGDQPSFSITINHIDTVNGITDKDSALTITAMSDECSKIDKDGTLEFARKFGAAVSVHIEIVRNKILKKRSSNTELSIK